MSFYLIILIGILLILFNYNAIKKEKKSFNSLLNNEVDNMDEFKVLLEENNQQFKEAIFDIQREIEDINTKFNSILEMDKNNDKILVEKVEIYDRIEDNKTKRVTRTKANKVTTDSSNNSSNNVKINEIRDLLKQGLSIEEVAENLNIGKGEVLLIKDLYLK